MPKTVSSEVRRRLIERAGWRCEYCLLPDENGGYPHQIDHTLSRKHSGMRIPANPITVPAGKPILCVFGLMVTRCLRK